MNFKIISVSNLKKEKKTKLLLYIIIISIKKNFLCKNHCLLDTQSPAYNYSWHSLRKSFLLSCIIMLSNAYACVYFIYIFFTYFNIFFISFFLN